MKQKSIHKLLVRNKLTLLLVGAMLICFSVVVLSLNFLTSALASLNLLPKPDSFTELFFSNHLELPSFVPLYQEQAFDFTIHNMENKDTAYNVYVYLDDGKQKTTIDRESITLKNGSSKVLTEKFAINSPTPHTEVVVNLLNKNQQIDFWIQSNQ